MSYNNFFRVPVRFSLIAILLLSSSFVQSNATDVAPASAGTTTAAPVLLDVYKSPTCGCCELWVTHMESNGYKSKIHHPDDLNAIKTQYELGPEYQSCHTAVSADGFVFEGHIPAFVITRFLNEKPKNARGLAVPGMPIGSPGMEMGERFTPYNVMLLKTDGSSEVYTRITSLEQTE